ncbi:MAG: RtcB family protein [Phycisphaeraceae bacterium]|nr:RtcB family protein [Phycisphaeraceae bacterium]
MKPEQHIAPIWTSCQERYPDEVAKMIEATRRLEDAHRVAIMPDVHLAGGFCIGTVLATRKLIYPSAVGSDIGCGMLALPLRAKAKRITPQLARKLLALLPGLVPAKRQREAILNLHLDKPRLSDHALDHSLKDIGLKQLGTLGSGNHFLELQREDGSDKLWLMIHSGSRGLGQIISEHHLAEATDRSFGRPYLDAEHAQGRRYLQDVCLARAYARLNRAVMARAVAFALDELAGIQADWSGVIHTDHNHVRKETLHGERLLIHRKGAAPAFDGLLSVIPGSMGTASYHVQGRGHADALRSSSHGAGRRLDRGTARRSIGVEKLKRAMAGVWFNEAAASKLRDEAPSAYKDIDAVVRQQHDQIKIVRRLMPVLNYKGA